VHSVEEVRSVAGRRLPGRRWVTLVLLATLLGATGCSTMHPGAAAVVGSTRIDAGSVDTIAAAYCSVTVAMGSPGIDQPTRDLRRGVLNALVQRDIVAAAARKMGGVQVPEARVREVVDAQATFPPSAPADEADTVRSFLGDVARTQLRLQEMGERLLGDSTAEPSPEEAVARGQRYVQRYAAGLDIEVDPRYGTYSPSGIDLASGSLSVPVSSEAEQAEQRSLGAGAELPASQTCA
jgi:hypothetical protein